jgi:hypothetical protein
MANTYLKMKKLFLLCILIVGLSGYAQDTTKAKINAMDHKTYESLKDIRVRLSKGKPVSFSERNFLVMQEKRIRKIKQYKSHETNTAAKTDY